MFLATTALTEFWDKNQKTLFLSSGCLPYGKRDEWESLDYQVMCSPWDDRRRFSEAVGYTRYSSRGGEKISTKTLASSAVASCGTSPGIIQQPPGSRSRTSSPI